MRPVAFLLAALTMSVIAGAQRSAPIDSKVSSIIDRMKDRDLSERESAFDDMMKVVSEEQASEEQNQAELSGRANVLTSFFTLHPDQAEKIKLGLIQLLNSEDDEFVKRKNAAPGRHTEEDGEYYAEVIGTVSSLDDERAIPALVGAMTTGGMAQRGLLKYGDRALEPVLAQLKNPDPLVRSVAVSAGVHILRKHDDPASRVRIRDIIQSSLKDSNLVVRGSAVQEIECIDERVEFVPLLEKLAVTDPAKLPGRALDGGDGEEFYPVRYDARRVLRDIQNNKTCAP